MDDAAGSASGWIAASIISLLGLAGGLIAWLFSRRDRSEETRSAKLDAWHKELLAREQLFIARDAVFQARVERLLAEQDEKIAGLEGDVEKYRVSTAALMARLAHHDPLDPVLQQVALLLGSAFPFAAGEAAKALDELLARIPAISTKGPKS